MKTRLNILFAILSMLPALAASAEARWLEETYDFGAFEEEGGLVTCGFRFINDGASPVAIVSARATCGCTIPQYPRSEILPGDTATVNVKFDPTGRPGRFEKKVYIDLSDGSQRKTLRITGVVIGSASTLRSRYPVEAGGMRLMSEAIAFGDVKKGQSKAVFFEVYNASADTLKPEWENLPPYIYATTLSPSIPPGEQTSYSVTFAADKTDMYGLVTDSIAIRQSPESGPVFIEYMANVVEDFSRLTPGQRANAPSIASDTESVDFGPFEPSEVMTRSFTVTNRGKDRLILRRVYSADPGVSASADRYEIKRGQKATITIAVDTSKLRSELLNARIAVISNDPGNPNLIIRAVGMAK